ncbi:hypothetical protein DFH05DRAFT_1531157 [Lentinula detonsa]|uniref:Uncharacterized protein n=1 Tax=Lentinula detonsa TaxID=2804962 RepID=A0A9W8NQ63_9AGAR|nr:hypothetical protein DFH05DRAFT_1531157 [Lentinula detonsa]
MRLLNLAATYIFIQGLALSTCAAPVGETGGLYAVDATKRHESPTNLSKEVTIENRHVDKTTGGGLSNISDVPSGPSQDTNSSTTPAQAKRYLHREEERRSLKDKLHAVVDALKGHGSSTGDSSSSADPSQATSASASPTRRSLSRRANRRTIKDKVHAVVDALKGQPASSEGTSSTSSEPSGSQDTASPPQRRALAVAVTFAKGEPYKLSTTANPAKMKVQKAVIDLLEAAAQPLDFGLGWRLDWENNPPATADGSSRIEFTFTGPTKCGGTCSAWVEGSKHEIKDHKGSLVYP